MAIGFGSSLPYCRAVVQLQAYRLKEHLERIPEVREGVPTWLLNGPIYNNWFISSRADAHYLLIAITHVVKHARHLVRLSEQFDERPKRRIQEFMNGQGKSVENVRGILEHFDRYHVGLETDHRKGITPDSSPSPDIETLNGKERIFRVGNYSFRLLELGAEATSLADDVDDLWREIEDNVSEEVQASGLP